MAGEVKGEILIGAPDFLHGENRVRLFVTPKGFKPLTFRTGI